MVRVEPPCSWRSMREINPGRLRQADEIHAAVLEEAAVFDGQHGVHHDLGNLVVGYQLPLGALLRVEERGDHLRFEFVGFQIAGFVR